MGPDAQLFFNTLSGETPVTVPICADGTGEARTVVGLLRSNAPQPKAYQIEAVQKALRTNPLLCVHTPGAGKTYTAIQFRAAQHVRAFGENIGVFIVSCPAACMLQWQSSIRNWLRIAEDRILHTQSSAEVTHAAIRKFDAIILSHCTVKCAFTGCHEQCDGSGALYRRTPNRVLHPLFAAGLPGNRRICLFVVDEVHTMCNKHTAVAQAHARLSSVATARLGLTGTPIRNCLLDLVGIAFTLGMPSHLTDAGLDAAALFRRFREYAHFVDQSELQLPRLNLYDVYVPASVPLEWVSRYNDELARLAGCAQSGKDASECSFLASITRLQQFLVSPKLLQHTAAGMNDERMLDEAATTVTGLVRSVLMLIQAIQRKGRRNVIVAAEHPSMLKVLQRYLLHAKASVGTVYMYHGDIRFSERHRVVAAFLSGECGVLLLSIESGGTGLDLVGSPGCNAMVFCMSRPYSPSKIEQCIRRIYRLGQTKPVHVYNVYCKGSVDYAISTLNASKAELANAFTKGDSAETPQSLWPERGTIMRNLCPLDVDTGAFVEESEGRVGGDAAQKRKRAH